MATRKKRRSKLGRKPAADPKINVTFYSEESKISAMGGMDKVRSFCSDALDKEVESRKQQ